MENEDKNTADELVEKTIESDEEYYGQEDIIQRSIRGLGEMFRHLGDPHFKNAGSFMLAYLFNLILITQSLFVLVFGYYYFVTFNPSDLTELPVFLFVFLEALFVAVLSIKIIIGMSKFLKKKNIIYSLIFLVSMLVIVVLLVGLLSNFFVPPIVDLMAV